MPQSFRALKESEIMRCYFMWSSHESPLQEVAFELQPKIKIGLLAEP